MPKNHLCLWPDHTVGTLGWTQQQKRYQSLPPATRDFELSGCHRLFIVQYANWDSYNKRQTSNRFHFITYYFILFDKNLWLWVHRRRAYVVVGSDAWVERDNAGNNTLTLFTGDSSSVFCFWEYNFGADQHSRGIETRRHSELEDFHNSKQTEFVILNVFGLFSSIYREIFEKIEWWNVYVYLWSLWSNK